MKKAFNFRTALVVVLVLVMCVAIFAACDQYDMTSLNNAKSFVKAKCNDMATTTPSNFDLIVKAPGTNGIFYDIVWTVSVTEGGDADSVKVVMGEDKATVEVPAKAENDIKYTLTATIADGDHSVSVEFKMTVPKWRELTWAEYIATAKDTAIVVKGYVTAFSSAKNGASYNTIYIQDENGGYYIYKLSEDPVDLGIKKGSYIRATGKKDLYSGTHEVVDATIEFLSETETVQTPVDYTEIYKQAATSEKKLKNDALVKKQGLLVTIKGVTITDQDVSGGYYKFSLDGMTSYVRISSSVCPLNKEDQKAFKQLHTEKKGWTADVTGVICVYDGAFYLTPAGVDAISNLQLPVLDDKGAVAAEKEILSFASAFTEDAEVTLAAKGQNYSEQVSITWAFKEGTTPKNAKIENGKLIVTLGEEEETVTLVATLKAGATTDTKEFTFTIDAASQQEYLVKPITEAKAGTYKLTMWQANLNKMLYFTGEINSSEYLVTSDKYAKAADVTLAAVDGGYTIKVGDKFLEIYKNSNNKIRAKLSDTATGAWKWNAELKLFTWNVDGKDYYLGTYNTFNTISTSEVSYISGDKANKIGVSQFVALLSNVVEAEYKHTSITEAKAGTYKLAMWQANLNKMLYFTGEINSSEYLVTSDKYAKAADVTLAAVDGGYTIKVGDKFLEIYKNSNNKIRAKLSDTATGAWKWNAELKLFTWNVDGKDYYLGTYNTFNTISTSEVSYISGDKANKIGVSQFVALLTIKEFV